MIHNNGFLANHSKINYTIPVEMYYTSQNFAKRVRIVIESRYALEMSGSNKRYGRYERAKDKEMIYRGCRAGMANGRSGDREKGR